MINNIRIRTFDNEEDCNRFLVRVGIQFRDLKVNFNSSIGEKFFTVIYTV